MQQFIKYASGWPIYPIIIEHNPQSLKLANVMPVHKYVSHDQPEHFKPVSNFPQISEQK